jgi:hypothetical protein
VLFAALLAAQPDGRAFYRRLFGGSPGRIAAAVLADFSGVLSLDRYNLSQLFYGAQYRRLQSLGNQLVRLLRRVRASSCSWSSSRRAGGLARRSR